jgi:hypothetical protein
MVGGRRRPTFLTPTCLRWRLRRKRSKSLASFTKSTSPSTTICRAGRAPTSTSSCFSRKKGFAVTRGRASRVSRLSQHCRAHRTAATFPAASACVDLTRAAPSHYHRSQNCSIVAGAWPALVPRQWAAADIQPWPTDSACSRAPLRCKVVHPSSSFRILRKSKAARRPRRSARYAHPFEKSSTQQWQMLS